MRMFVKVLGPPYIDAIKALEKIALETPEVCVMNTILMHGNPYLDSLDWIYNYFKGLGNVSYQRCSRIISEHRQLLGEHDFFYEWFQEPSKAQLEDLIEKMDEALKPIGAMYTIKMTQ